MTYAEVLDIQNEFRNIVFDSSFDITDAKVTSFLEQTDAEINLCLSNKYIVPITGVESLKILKRIEIAIVAARVASILDLKQFANQPSKIKQEFNKKDFQDFARKQLDNLKNERITLIDATLIDQDFGMSSGLIDDCSTNSSNSIDDCPTTVFKRGIDLW